VGIGTSTDTIRIAGATPLDAFDQVMAAMTRVGRVIEVDADEFFVRGTTRYGLQKVRLKVKVEQDGGDSLVKIDALADDIWGKGARSGSKKLREALGG
jgi:hypothetical protein